MAVICGILESLTTQWYQGVVPTQEFFFFIVASIVYGWTQFLSLAVQFIFG